MTKKKEEEEEAEKTFINSRHDESYLRLRYSFNASLIFA